MTDADRLLTESHGIDVLRAELRAAYPAIDTRAVARIIRRLGWTTLPGALLAGVGLVGSPRTLARAVGRARDNGGHPLFSSLFYRAANDDVARSGAPAWLHYQTFGRVEGRAPHPLIDPSYLAAGLGEGFPGEAVDRYLVSPESWIADPGPYVTVRRFLESGVWDGRTHPLEQIIASHLDGPWVHSRLLMIDSGAGEPAVSRLAAVGSLLIGRGTPSSSHISVWTRGATPQVASEAPEPIRVIPGFFVGSRGVELWGATNETVSADGTARRTSFETVTVTTGPTVEAKELVVFTGDVGRAKLAAAVTDAHEGTVFAPANVAQETSLRQLRRDLGRSRAVSVLAAGQQVEVRGARMQLVEPESLDVPDWQPEAVAPTRTAIVLRASERILANADPVIRSMVAGGASLCLIDDRGLNSWLTTIQNRDVVAAPESLLHAVAAFVPADRIRRRI